MSNQIELAGHEGDVVLVNGICYAFTEYTAPVVVDCNDCDPQLARSYTVTLSGLIGPWLAWNGAHTVTWKDGCNWWDSEDKLSLYVPEDSSFWRARLAATPSDTLMWVGGFDVDCNPPIYNYGNHVDCTSDDPADCLAQDIALCVVTALGVTASFNTCEECAS